MHLSELVFLAASGQLPSGAAGLSAYPMAARFVQTKGQRWNKQNHLLMPAMATNTGGQVGSVMAAAIMLSVLMGLGFI